MVVSLFCIFLLISWAVACASYHREPPLHPECWYEWASYETCCRPPAGLSECFPAFDTQLTYEYCCELPDSEQQNDLTSGSWLDTRFFRGSSYHTDKWNDEVISAQDLIKMGSHPYLDSWCNELTQALAKPDPTCSMVYVFVQRMAHQLRNHLMSVLESAHDVQETVFAHFRKTGSFLETVYSPAYQAMLGPMMLGHRYCMNAIEFASTMMLMHRECFFPNLRGRIGRMVASAKDASQAYMELHFSIAYMSMFGLRPESTNAKQQFEPLWKFYDKVAEVGSHCLEVIREANGSRQEFVMLGGFSRPAVSYGGFSEMQVLSRRISNGWHLDHGLVASMLRLWPPPEEGHRMSIADFGAGGGHYCDFFNKTEQYDCFAFDGAQKIDEYTDRKVTYLRLDLPFDLGRKFDWVMSLEVAEHLSPEAANDFVRNLRRHTSVGLILSWSVAFHDEVHPNAMGMHEVRTYLHERGLVWDSDASSTLKPVLSWMRGNVNVYRPV